MSSRTRTVTCSLALGVAALAIGSPGVGAAGADDQWATVNICDTAKHPNALGIRGRAPGNNTTQNIWMRFFAQRRTSTGSWVQVRSSPWVKLGTSNFTWREAGRTFFFDGIPAGQSFRYRGRVRMEWRKNGNVVRSVTEITEGGHHAAGGGDPKGYSAATCRITG